MPLDALPCEYLFTITADTGERPPAVLAGTPSGTRVVVTVMKGTFSGPKCNGTIADVAGGDWVVMRPDGSLKLDVRLVLQTDDGALVYMAYSGIGHRAADGSMNIRTAPLFETGDERYGWLNGIQAVPTARPVRAR